MSRENERLHDKLSPIIEPAAGNQRGMEVDLVAIPSWFGVHVSEDRVPVRQEEAVEVCVFGLWVGCDGANDPPGPPLIGRPSASQRCSFTEVMAGRRRIYRTVFAEIRKSLSGNLCEFVGNSSRN